MYVNSLDLTHNNLSDLLLWKKNQNLLMYSDGLDWNKNQYMKNGIEAFNLLGMRLKNDIRS